MPTNRTALDWTEAGAGLLASCGEEDQGLVLIYDGRDGSFVWSVDMLPDDPEPVIYGTAPTLDAAKEAAERQVAAWPALIEGATRDD